MIKRKYEGDYITAFGCFNDGIMKHYTQRDGQQVDEWVDELQGWEFETPGISPVPHWYQFWRYLAIARPVAIEGVREISHITLNCVELEDLEGIAWYIYIVPEDYTPQAPYIPMHIPGTEQNIVIWPTPGLSHLVAQGMFDLEGAHPYEIDAKVQLTSGDGLALVFATPVRGEMHDVSGIEGDTIWTEFRIRPFQYHVSYYVKYL